MKKTINYEKSLLFKTNIGEICSISLEHDFTVDDMCLKGDFIVSGEYKANELSVNRENFSFRLPLEYELEKNVILDSINYDIENFEYNTKGDELNVNIDFGITYDEKEEEVIPIKEETLNAPIVIPDIEEKLNAIRTEVVELPKLAKEETIEVKEEPIVVKEETREPQIEETSKVESKQEERISESEEQTILENTMNEDTYITYHVHIVREGETLETIAMKYNATIDLIKEYNTFDTLELKSKLIIPELNE